jgi:copper chaperone
MARIFGVTLIVINVNGMSCEHCATAVRTEISGLPGVTDVDVDVASGEVKISAEPVPDDAALRAAVDAAGYELAQ